MKEKQEKPFPNRIAVDFDGTLCDSHFNHETGLYDMGKVIEVVAVAVTDQHFAGKDILIFTSRPKKEWPEVREWLDKEGIPYSKIKKKPLAQLYVDDRAIRPDEFVIWNRINQHPTK